MVITVKNYNVAVTKGYKLGEIDSRMPFLTDIVRAKNTEAWAAGRVVVWDAPNNYFELGAADVALTRVAVCVDAKAETDTRANVLICGIICVETTTVLVEGDNCKIAAGGLIAKWVSGTDAIGLQHPIIFMKQADKINEGLGKAVTNATTTAPGKYVLVWVNSPFA